MESEGVAGSANQFSGKKSPGKRWWGGEAVVKSSKHQSRISLLSADEEGEKLASSCSSAVHFGPGPAARKMRELGELKTEKDKELVIIILN